MATILFESQTYEKGPRTLHLSDLGHSGHHVKKALDLWLSVSA